MVSRLGVAYSHLTHPLVSRAPPLSSFSPSRAKPAGTHVGLCLLRSRALGGSSNAFLPDDQDDSFRPPRWLLEAPPERPRWLLSMAVDPTQVNTERRGTKKHRKDEYWEEGLKEEEEEGGESAVKKAFSSLVLMIREMHSCSLKLREVLFYEDLRGVLRQVQKEVHASFCWLFHRVFSCTPALMLSLMLLLANFTVHSMSHPAFAAPLQPPPITTTTTTSDHLHQRDPERQVQLEGTIIKTTHLDGGGGGGGGKKARPVAGARDDNGRSPSRVGPTGASVAVVEEAWRKVVKEVAEMEGGHVLVDKEVRRAMVAPVRVEVEPDVGYPEYFRTELVYRRALDDRPNDQMLLSNYAQFLFLVVHDHRRAEHYFKRAIKELPVDGETLSRYANFLWVAKNDLSTAEETFLEAIAADPSNTAHAARYAHFLWSTGGEGTCFPLDGTGEAA